MVLPRESLARAEEFARRHVSWIVALLVLAGFVLRVRAAMGTYFNGDEAHIMLPPLQRDLFEVYRSGTRFPYGPLGNYLLHTLTLFGSSELLFRMPAILAGALAPWAAFRWIAFRFDAAAGLIAAAILALSPNFVLLSAEVRHYTLHALFLLLALDAFERALAANSLRWLRLSGLWLLLALLTLYMTVWFLAAFTLYAAWRMWLRRPPARLLLEFAGLLALSGGILAAAYFTHLVHLRDSQGEVLAREVYLRTSYYQPREESIPGFLAHATVDLVRYVLPHRFAAGGLLLYVAGVAAAAVGRVGNLRAAAVSLALPLVAAAAAAIARLYPYGGTRHDYYLAPFVAAGVGLAVSWLLSRRLLAAAAGGILVAALLLTSYGPRKLLAWYAPELIHPRADLEAVVAFLERDTEHRVLVGDQETVQLLEFYVCRGDQRNYHDVTPDLAVHDCRRWRTVRRAVWTDSPVNLLASYIQARSLEPETLRGPAWIITHPPERAPHQSSAREAAFGRFRVQHAD